MHSNPEATSSLAFVHTSTSFHYAVTHVFLPVQLPRHNDYTLENDLSLARAVCAAARAYSVRVHGASGPQWHRTTRMLDNLETSVRSEQLDRRFVIFQLCGMQAGDILTFFIRPQNAAIVLTKREKCTLFESFEVSPRSDAIENTAASLMCSYPWSAVEIPNEVFDDEHFRFELANFLSRPSTVDSDLPPPPTRPQYITALLTGILRCVGRIVDAPLITKRVCDDILQRPSGDALAEVVWRRSSLWLLIKIAIQMSVDRSPLGRASYKQLMLFFICTLAKDQNSTNLPSDLLHLMSSKVFRRSCKLGPSIPDWLSEMARKTCASLREILDSRWMQLNPRPSLFRNPSQEELVTAIKLSLLDSREYIHSALMSSDHEPLGTPFYPSHHRRGTIDDFLSSNGTFFEEVYDADPGITLFDVEKSVEQGIDDWSARVTDVDEACVQLEILMDKYMIKVITGGREDQENKSIMLLTTIELFVALDKLVVREIPMLADYSPEIPISFLENLLLRKTTSLHRLARAYQYLCARQSQSRPGWSVLSNEFTEDSFPVRYYDQSPHLWQLKARIEQDAMVAGRVGLQRGTPHRASTYDGYQGNQQDLYGRLLADGAEPSHSPLPASPLHAKVIIFELQCPACLRIWRSAASRILRYLCHSIYDSKSFDAEKEDNLLAHVSKLRPYFVDRKGPPLSTQIHFVYFHPGGFGSRNSPTLRFAIQYVTHNLSSALVDHLSVWKPKERYNIDGWWSPLSFAGRLENRSLRERVDSTSHSSNDVLSVQADCPADLSLDEFIAFGNLRSSGSLQWLNILRGLHSRTLNLRRHDVHFLLAQATLQVGPIDLNTGMWLWHKELQESSFCNALLDELANLFVEVGAGSIDGVMMSTLSLLLIRVLASSPSERVSDRAIALLRSVRRKAFRWVQELSYNLAMAPTNAERSKLLQEMAVTCRSTFDIHPATLCKLSHSAEDVDAILSCTFLIHALRPGFVHDPFSQPLLERDCRLTHALEGTLRKLIFADASDYGVDLAAGKIFPSHKPGAQRWEQLHYPNDRWLTCRTRATRDQPSQTVHLDLLDGVVRVDGQPFGGLARAIGDSPEYQEIFRDQGFFLVPSNLPGMQFTTLATMSEHKVHFSLRYDNLVIRAQYNQSNDILELIPSRKLCGDLPPALVDGHVHWLNLSTQIIEIRPLEQIWKQCSDGWRIDCTPGQYRMYKGRETLVDIRSPTWEMVSKCFECLNNVNEDAESQSKDLLITTSPINSPQCLLRLSIALPRYALSFFVNEGEELESRDFEGMVYDENQDIGALFGLESLLVLRQKTHFPEELIARRIIIPNGVPIKEADYQVRVHSRQDPAPPLPGDPFHYHTYTVDTELGRLTGDDGLTSTQYLAYLHAETSCHTPDPLTGKTGAQTALCLLQSAGCRSIMKLRALDFDDAWASTQYPQINIAYKETQKRFYWTRYMGGSEHARLHEKRAARRAAYLFPSNATGLISSQDCEDMDYSAPEEDLELERVAFIAASAVHRWSTSAPTMDNILGWAELWSRDICADPAVDPSLHDGPEIWSNPDLVQTLMIKVQDILEQGKGTSQHFQLLFLLPVMAFCSPCHQAAFISMLIAFAKQSEFPSGNSLIYADCKISDGYHPAEEVLRHRIRGFRLKERHMGWSVERHSVNAAVKHLLKHWPSDTPPTVSLDLRYWDVAGLTTSLQQLFSSCFRNFHLKERLMRIHEDPGLLPTLPRPVPSLQYISNEHVPLQITLDQLLSNRPAPDLPPRTTLLRNSHQGNKVLQNDLALDALFSSLRTDPSIQREYITHLAASTQRVREESRITHRVAGENQIGVLEKHYAHCRDSYLDALGILKNSLGPTTDLHEQAFSQFSQWPPTTAEVLLRYLASTSQVGLPGQWKKCLVSLALLLLDLQRSRRLLRFALDGLEEEFSKELENEGCDGWNPEEYPDWLLIQVQGNFLIRRVQAETAMEMISPQSGENTVMQVNMGEGKSSVIIPIAAAVLADGKQLLRIIVPKALTVQMFDSLIVRLGVLTNRPIYHLPFSRSPEFNYGGKVTSLQIDDLHKLMSQCMVERGILLVQSEHVASVKLMSVEEQISKGNLVTNPLRKLPTNTYRHIMTALSFKSLPRDSLAGNIFRLLSQLRIHASKKNPADVDHYNEYDGDVDGASKSAAKWLSLDKWIHSHTRDILDESDEILHPRFQMIYTMGLQQHMDGYPDRWTITQQVLRLVKKYAGSLSRCAPDSMEYEHGVPLGSFPQVRITPASDVGVDLISLLVKDVMDGQLPNFTFQHLSAELHSAIRSFISDENILQIPDTAKRVEEYAKRSHQSYLWSGLLLLRGLLASNILLFAFSEWRWRVNYGLVLQPRFRDGSPTSTMLAVPYRAKDVPALDTQFGHPDITIILTCLSYYYAGLSEEQLRVAFEILLDQDDPSTEYALWIKEYDDASMPDSLRQLGEINLKASEQWDKDIFPLFTRNQGAIDFYLSRVVFPQEAKEFPSKLSASSWDLAEKRENVITGFSGTNDGQWLLPMSIAQRDLDHHKGTNGRVLAYLLQPANDCYMVTQETGERQTTPEFLQMVVNQRPRIRVLLDIGAQILDCSNLQVAKAWLDLARDTAGAIYFNEHDELMVLTKNGTTQSMVSSPLSQQLGRCIVYLDHAHTRGTDIKLPNGSRAAITLGPRVTKDQLVQGCMRMRKLGHGHSVMFFAPLEVDRTIHAVAGKKDPNSRVTHVDILHWAIHETCADIRRRAPYWARQGMSHKSRYKAWARFRNNELGPDRLSDAWLQPERKSLVDLYAPCEAQHPSTLPTLDPEILQRCKDLGVLSFPDAQMDEEQEREVEREREREREVGLPPKAQPAEHYLHPDIVKFVKTGDLPPLHASTAFHPVFTTLEKSSAVTRDADVWSPFILATADFWKTIEPESTQGTVDQYLRPVQWILSRTNMKDRDPLLVLLSPFEVDRLMPDIRASEYVHLHLYAPRTSQRMKPCDDLTLYSIPPLPSDWSPPWDLIDQLNVFAGQLYLTDHESYLRLCRFLGVPTKGSTDESAVRWNLFNIPGSFEENEVRFSGSPLPAVMALLAIRNRGRPFAQTHMGRILQGQLLTQKDFERPMSVVSGHNPPTSATASTR